MRENEHRITVDIKNEENYIKVPVIRQNDDVTFIVTILDDDLPFSLTGVDTVTFTVERSDKSTITYPATITNDNEVTIKVPRQAVNKVGRTIAIIQMYGDNRRVSTMTFYFEVKKDSATNYEPSEREKTLIEIVLNDAPLIIQEARDATDYANAAGDYANAEGTRAKNEADRAKAEADHISDTVEELNDRLDNLVANTGDSNTEIVDARLGADGVARATLKKRLDDDYNNVTAQLAQTTKQFQSNEKEESATLGEELIDGSGWTMGNGWSGDFASGFTHVKGYSAPLTKALSGLGTKFYQVEVTVESPSNTKASNSGWTVTIGGSEPFEMYEGNFTEHTYIRGIQALNGTDLVIMPETGFDGTITNVSVKEIIGTVIPTTQIKDSEDINSFEIKPTKAENDNVFIGKNNAIYNTTGNRNVGIGVNSLKNNTTGFWNVAIGYDALTSNQVGSRNVALGYIALRRNISGHRNIAIGPFNMHDNTHGHNNISMGADTMQRNTTGNYNVAIGLNVLANNLTGSDSIGIGYNALGANTVSGLIGIGRDAATRNTTGTENIAIGLYSLKYNKTGGRNLVIGHNSLNNAGAEDVFRNLVIGSSSGQGMISGAQYNVLIGHNVGNTLSTGDFNILIGYNLDVPSATDSNILNIGNFLYGRMSSSNPRLGLGVPSPAARLHLAASDGSNTGVTMKIEPGTLVVTPITNTIEYDGTNLYWTDNNGVRRKFAMEAV